MNEQNPQVQRKQPGRADIIVPAIRERILMAFACDRSIRDLSKLFEVRSAVIEDVIRRGINADPRTTPTGRVIPMRRLAA